MAVLKVNDKMPNFNVDTIYERKQNLSDLLGDNKTAILFYRYEGCTLCRFDMMNLKEDYDAITAVGGKAIVVLQSDPDKLQREITKGHFPYLVICDPEKKLYKALDIKPSSSMEEMIEAASKEKMLKVRDSGLEHGDYEGEEMQLPAFFVVDKDLNVLHSHYGKAITDMPEVDEIVEALR